MVQMGAINVCMPLNEKMDDAKYSQLKYNVRNSHSIMKLLLIRSIMINLSLKTQEPTCLKTEEKFIMIKVHEQRISDILRQSIEADELHYI